MGGEVQQYNGFPMMAGGGSGLTKTDIRQEAVLRRVVETSDLKKINNNGERIELYYRKSDNEPFSLLTTNDANRLINQAYKRMFGVNIDASKAKTYRESLGIREDIEDIGRIPEDEIMITNGLYWDNVTSGLHYAPSGNIFRRLFNSRNIDRVRVDDTYWTAEERKTFVFQFDDYYAHIKANEGYFTPISLRDMDDKSLPGRTKGLFLDIDDQPLNAFWVWANEDLDKFNDLLKAVAANFMRVKPKGAFILIGRTRNGKSSFIKMLHTLFGKNNTSELKLTELNDSHVNMGLLGSMLNAPDEEDEGKGKEVLKAQALFKTITSHEPISIPVFYSQTPQPVPTDFMCYFPMNDTPQWQGSGAEACMKRSFILNFDADLSRFDNNARDFEKETYTSDFYRYLLPLVLAFAKYYNEHPFKLSDTQKKNQQLINEEVDNVSVYLNEFQKYFPGGYASVGLIWDDYKCWCESRGLLWKGRQEFSRKLKVIGGKPSKLTVGNEVINITRIEKSGAVLHDNFIMWDHDGLSVKDLLYPGDGMKPRSVIEYLNTHANKKSKDKEKEEEKARRAKESEEWGKEFWEKRKDDEDTLNAIKGLGW